MQTKLIFSPDDSPVNHTQWLENERERMTRDISGRKCLDALEKLSPVGSLARMFSALLIGQTGWYSTKCKLTWKLKGTKFSRMYCQLYPSTPPIEGTGFGLLPTPKTMDGMAENVNSGKELKLINGSFVNVRPKDGMRFGPSLNDIARHQMLPTPRASDCVPKWPSENWKGNSDLNLVLNGINGTRSHLSPHFVLEMMGFPPNWTELPFLNGEKNQSKPEATQSSHK